MDEELQLKVAEALPRDVGRGIARIDPKVMEERSLQSGDVVEVRGSKRAYAIVLPGRPEDYGRGTIRIDGEMRSNAGARIDDVVSVRRVEVRRAEKITIAPTEPLMVEGGEEYFGRMLEGRVVYRGYTVSVNVMGRRVDFVVSNISPPLEAVLVTPDTQISISKEVVKGIPAGVSRVTYEDIGGMKEQIQKVREMVELPLRHPELFERLGVEAPKGVLLYGPPGTGKTLLAKAIANEVNANFYSISGPEIMSKFYGESEERLREVFKQARENAPSIIFIDELDSIAPKREEVTGEVEKRVVAQLLSLMDGLEERGKVVVIGATNRPDAIDPALRRPGRFDREIEIGVPDANARHEILMIHTRGMPLDSDVDLRRIAEMTHGFVGADIAALAKEAALRALRRILPDIDLRAESVPASILQRIKVTMRDFLDALKDVHPSALREVFVESPNVHWDDIGDLVEVKRELVESVEWPLKYRELFEHAGGNQPRGILLYGPPGTGKTLLAKALATEAGVNFISVKGPELLSKWVGESERGVREVFRKARTAAPCIIFFDEVDALAPMRGIAHGDSMVTERVISQLLTELDGLQELRNVVVVAATNRPDILDPALLRAGRFDKLIKLTWPDVETRRKIFEVHLRNKPMAQDVDVQELAEMTEGFTGADIEQVTNEAGLLALQEALFEQKVNAENDLKPKEILIARKHMLEAVKKVRVPTQEERKYYEEITDRFATTAKSELVSISKLIT